MHNLDEIYRGLDLARRLKVMTDLFKMAKEANERLSCELMSTRKELDNLLYENERLQSIITMRDHTMSDDKDGEQNG